MVEASYPYVALLYVKAAAPVIQSALAFSSLCFHGLAIFMHREAFIASSASNL
jgi:hypothetical protein